MEGNVAGIGLGLALNFESITKKWRLFTVGRIKKKNLCKYKGNILEGKKAK